MCAANIESSQIFEIGSSSNVRYCDDGVCVITVYNRETRRLKKDTTITSNVPLPNPKAVLVDLNHPPVETHPLVLANQIHEAQPHYVYGGKRTNFPGPSYVDYWLKVQLRKFRSISAKCIGLTYFYATMTTCKIFLSNPAPHDYNSSMIGVSVTDSEIVLYVAQASSSVNRIYC